MFTINNIKKSLLSAIAMRMELNHGYLKGKGQYYGNDSLIYTFTLADCLGYRHLPVSIKNDIEEFNRLADKKELFVYPKRIEFLLSRLSYFPVCLTFTVFEDNGIYTIEGKLCEQFTPLEWKNTFKPESEFSGYKSCVKIKSDVDNRQLLADGAYIAEIAEFNSWKW